MSITYDLYVGPYIHLTEMTQKAEEDAISCANNKCESFSKNIKNNEAIYCSRCGKKLKKTLAGSPIKINIDEEFLNDYLDENDDELFEIYFGANESVIMTSGNQSYDLDYEQTPINFNPTEANLKIKEFKKCHSLLISDLEKMIGKNNVKVCYGVVPNVG